MAIGSPSHAERPNRTQSQAARNVRVTSARAARLTTRPPRHTTKKPNKAKSPHWPGETQTLLPVKIIIRTMPKLVGLKMCLPFQRRVNLLAMVTNAVAAARSKELVRSKRQRERPEMSALLGSNAGTLQMRVRKY